MFDLFFAQDKIKWFKILTHTVFVLFFKKSEFKLSWVQWSLPPSKTVYDCIIAVEF